VAASEFALRDIASVDSGPAEEADSPETEIQTIFRLKIAGLRRLPCRERAQAFRAALEWLWFAMSALRESAATNTTPGIFFGSYKCQSRPERGIINSQSRRSGDLALSNRLMTSVRSLHDEFDDVRQG
jgi:hypothetical protein